MYSWTNKEIKSYKNLALQFNQPAGIQVSSSLSLPLECDKSEGFWALFSRAESRTTYMSIAAKIFLIFITVHKEQIRKLTKKNVNLKRELLTVAPQ